MLLQSQRFKNRLLDILYAPEALSRPHSGCCKSGFCAAGAGSAKEAADRRKGRICKAIAALRVADFGGAAPWQLAATRPGTRHAAQVGSARPLSPYPQSRQPCLACYTPCDLLSQRSSSAVTGQGKQAARLLRVPRHIQIHKAHPRGKARAGLSTFGFFLAQQAFFALWGGPALAAAAAPTGCMQEAHTDARSQLVAVTRL